VNGNIENNDKDDKDDDDYDELKWAFPFCENIIKYMGCKPNFLYNTAIRRSSEALFLTGKLCILEDIFHKMEKPILIWSMLMMCWSR
jgi:hypothetical protein